MDYFSSQIFLGKYGNRTWVCRLVRDKQSPWPITATADLRVQSWQKIAAFKVPPLVHKMSFIRCDFLVSKAAFLSSSVGPGSTSCSSCIELWHWTSPSNWAKQVAGSMNDFFIQRNYRPRSFIWLSTFGLDLKFVENFLFSVLLFIYDFQFSSQLFRVI